MGRERRRRGAINRLRRFFYGVMLLMAVPVAAVSNELGGAGKHRGEPAPPVPGDAEQVAVGGLLALRARPDGGPEVFLESAAVRGPDDGNAAPQPRIGARADGATFAVAGMGRFHLQLKTERTPALSAWALGGALKVSLDGGRAAATEIPVLRINDLYRGETRFLAFDAAVEQDPAGEPRLAFRWRI